MTMNVAADLFMDGLPTGNGTDRRSVRAEKI